MKIVIAPQTFKGSISALDVAAAMAEGVRRVVPDAYTDLVPVADGGDGTLETLVEATGGEVHTAVGHRPTGRHRRGRLGSPGRRPHSGRRDGPHIRAGPRPTRQA